MQIRMLFVVFVAAFTLVSSEERDTYAGAGSVLPVFEDGTWEIEEVRRWADNPAFTVTFYGRPNGKGKEGGMSLRFGDFRSPEILKAWGGTYVSGRKGFQEGYNALLLDDKTWAVSSRGKPYGWKLDRVDGDYFIVISVFTEQGTRSRTFPIKHAI